MANARIGHLADDAKLGVATRTELAAGSDPLTGWYNFRYTRHMKTAVSVPDRIFDAAERVAKRLGISRSELYARAVASFVEEHRGDKVTEALDRLHAKADSRLDPTLTRLQTSSLSRDEW